MLGPLHVANCRFVLDGSHSLTTATHECTIHNCEFVGTSRFSLHMILDLPTDGTAILENNAIVSPIGHALDFHWDHQDLRSAVIHLKHNTIITPSIAMITTLDVVPEAAEAGAAPDRQPIQMHISGNVFDPINPVPGIFSLLLPPHFFHKDAQSLSATEAQALLPRLMDWHAERNLYGKFKAFQSIRLADDSGNKPVPGLQTLADWQQLWKAGTSGSLQGVIRYEVGDVLAKMEATPELVTAADFRLRSDSAGYRGGKDGKDLGADVDLVGPGAAYERWKKTPDYQQWLKDTGQVKK